MYVRMYIFSYPVYYTFQIVMVIMYELHELLKVLA